MMMAKVSATVMLGKGLDTQLCIQHIFRFIDRYLVEEAQESVKNKRRIKLPAHIQKKY